MTRCPRFLDQLIGGVRTASDAARGFGICLALLFGIAAIAMAQPVPLPPGTTGGDQEQQKPASDPLGDVESAIEAKNYALAASRLDVYVSAHPDDARALFDRGYVEDAQGHTDAAEGWYRKAVAADPKQFESRLALGLLLAAKGDAGAREQLDAAAQLEPNPPNPAPKRRRIGLWRGCCARRTPRAREMRWWRR